VKKEEGGGGTKKIDHSVGAILSEHLLSQLSNPETPHSTEKTPFRVMTC